MELTAVHNHLKNSTAAAFKSKIITSVWTYDFCVSTGMFGELGFQPRHDPTAAMDAALITPHQTNPSRLNRTLAVRLVELLSMDHRQKAYSTLCKLSSALS